MRFTNRKGIALVASIMLIIFASVAVLGVVVFIAQRLKQYNTEEIWLKCIYLAQAGLNYAMYQYRATSTLYSGTVSNIDGNGGYAVIATTSGGGSRAADNLITDATGSYLASGNQNLQGITIRNTSGSAITIDRMIIDWSGPNNSNLQSIVINGVTVWSGSVKGPPVNLDISNFTLSPSTTYPVTYLYWSGAMNGRTITLQFVMTDATTTSICTVYPAPASACQSSVLTIKSMGKTTGSNIYRTVQAAYNTVTGNVTSRSETNASVP